MIGFIPHQAPIPFKDSSARQRHARDCFPQTSPAADRFEARPNALASRPALAVKEAQRNSDRKKWRRSKRGIGTSKTRVSLASNSNSSPQSGAGQFALSFALSKRCADGWLTTTHVPHFGHVTHGHAMRSAIRPDYIGERVEPGELAIGREVFLRLYCVYKMFPQKEHIQHKVL